MKTIAHLTACVLIAASYTSLPIAASAQIAQATSTAPPSGLVTNPPGTTPVPSPTGAANPMASPTAGATSATAPQSGYQTTTTTTVYHHGPTFGWLGWLGLLGLLGLIGLRGRSSRPLD